MPPREFLSFRNRLPAIDTPLKISVGPYDLESELTVMSDMAIYLDCPPNYTARQFM
jgi:hypothetical protein